MFLIQDFVYDFDWMGVRIGIGTAWVFSMTRRRQSANTLAVVPEPLSASVAMLCELSFFCTVGIVLNLACSRIVRTVSLVGVQVLASF